MVGISSLAQNKFWVKLVIICLIVLCLLAIMGTVISNSQAHGGFSSAEVNGLSQYSSGTGLISDTISPTQCLSSPNAAGGIVSNDNSNCTTYPLARSPGSSLTTDLLNTGSLTPSAASVSTTNTCGVQEFVDVSGETPSNPSIALGGVTYQQTGPTQFTDSPASVGFDGTSGWGETVVGGPFGPTFYAPPGPQTFSIAAWFKTTTSGSIIGFTNSQSNTGQTNWDRQIWVDSAGNVVFGVYPNAIFEVASAGTNYADGNWHFVVATVEPSATTGFGTVELYVDGSLVAGGVGNESDGGNGNYPAQNYGGWWHLGWSNASNGWTDGPTNPYWTGSLADIAVFPSALGATEISTLYGETTQAGFYSAVLSDSPKSYWPLQDNGTALYTASLSNVPDSDTYPDDSANPGTNTGTGWGWLTTDPYGPIGDKAAAFDGSSAWIETTTGPPTAFYASPGPQKFSIAAWFKTTTSGSIIGFTNSQSNTGQTNWDRQIWVDSAGNVVFGLYPNAIFEVASAGTNYADGKWHFVVATVKPATRTKATVKLYVDGSLVTGGPKDEPVGGNGGDPAQKYGGWWHLGWSNASNGWTDGPTNPYWTGSLGQIAIFPSFLSAAKVATLYSEATAGAYAAAVTGGVATSNSFWPLDGTVTPGPCGYIGVTIQASTGVCIYPPSSSPCPSPPTSEGLAVDEPIPIPLPNLTFTTALMGTITPLPPTAAVGLHVSVGWAIKTSYGGFSAEIDHGEGYVLL